MNIETTGITRQTVRQIRELLDDKEHTAFSSDEKNIWFQLIGNKMIDYAVLDRIKELLLKKKKVSAFSIFANEFVESSDGYDFDSEEAD